MEIRDWICLSCLVTTTLAPYQPHDAWLACPLCSRTLQPRLRAVPGEASPGSVGCPSEDAPPAGVRAKPFNDYHPVFDGWYPRPDPSYQREEMVCRECTCVFDLWTKALRVWRAKCPYCGKMEGVCGR